MNINQLDREIKNTSRWAGKVLVIVHQGEPLSDFRMLLATFGSFLKAAFDARAVAIIGGDAGSESEGMNLTHTGDTGEICSGAVCEIPVVSMVMEDQEQIQRFLDQGKPVRMKINV